ncbi:MAG: DUF4127 family protein [Lachnospiraceae bacterium]|nr:DUF4127 family protein [Lachnospiraceae bacterium]
MTKILYVPLDDRDCNYEFPYRLSLMTEDMELLRPPYEWMGFLKQPADQDKIWEWLFKNAQECEYAILSVDTLVYGNIIGSRIHHNSMERCAEYMEGFRRLKLENPRLHIHAFNLAARVAAYNDAHEDPDYWEDYGRDIWKYTWLTDKKNRAGITEEEQKEAVLLKERIPENILKDFLDRREIDRFVNLTSVDLVKEGVFDILTVPKDDTAEFGYAAMDQLAIAQKVERENVMSRVYCYPGADEAGSVLFSRVFCLCHDYHPAIYVRYSSLSGSSVVPLFEDRPLGESIKWQIISAGGICTETPVDSNAMLAVNAPGKRQIQCADQKNGRDFASDNCTNTEEMLRYIEYYRDVYNKAVGISDVTMANGCDNAFMARAQSHHIFDRIQAFGGWNTAENTNGVVIAMLIIASYYDCWKQTPDLGRNADSFLGRALIADWLCQANVLRMFLDSYAKQEKIDPYFLKEKEEKTRQFFLEKLSELIEEKMGGTLKNRRLILQNIRFNWNGAFYFAIDAKVE